VIKVAQISVSSRWFSGLLVVAAAVLAGCAGAEKAKPTALEPNTALLGVRQAWVNKLGPVGFALDMRVVGNQLVAADSTGVVVAIDAVTGGDIWRTTLNTPLSAGVGSDGRYASVVTRENELVVLEGGKELWRQRLSAVTLTSPLVAGARVFTLSGDRTVAAFDAASGRKLWQQQRTGDPLVLGQSGAVYAVGDILAVGLGGRLVGFNSLNGNVRWDISVANSRGTNEIERLVDLVAGVSRVGDSSCLRAFQSAVACVNTTRASVDWSKPANGSTGLHGDASLVVGTESDSRIIAWRRTDGERLWVSERFRFRGLTTPMLLGRSVVVGDDTGLVHFLSRDDGAPLNRLPTDGSAIVGAPVLSGQTLIVATRRGGVFGFRPE
jgi:outer membrane assembly lipoprotein YfgL